MLERSSAKFKYFDRKVLGLAISDNCHHGANSTVGLFSPDPPQQGMFLFENETDTDAAAAAAAGAAAHA